jgi:hypothetical protein
MPTLAAGKACPVSGFGGLVNFAKYGVAKGIGPGPAYPIGFTQPSSILEFVYPPDPRSGFVADRGQRYRPSYTRLRAPGWYAYEIDGTSFSHVIVFRAGLGFVT